MIARRPVTLAWLALAWERAAPVLVWPLAGLGVYLALALFGVFERFGDPWRVLAALAIVIACALLARHSLRGFSWPGRRDAQRRVEADSGLSHREFEALEDHPATGNPALWQAHRARMAARLEGVRARRPHAAWARLDPYGLRISLILVLAAGAFLAGDLARYRVVDAFALRPLSGGAGQPVADLWIEPPDYTGEPTLYLRNRRSAVIPEGSVLAARLAGSARRPHVSGAEAGIERIDDRVWQVRAPIEQSGDVIVRTGPLAERLSLTVQPDTVPHITLAAEPESDAEGVLQLEFVARDDYGVERHTLEVAAEAEERGGTIAPEAWQSIDISPGSVSPTGEEDRFTARIDVARHPLSGRRVAIRIAGTDGAGQTGRSTAYEMTLPARVFLDPLAKAVAAERRDFLGSGREYEALEPGEPEPVFDRATRDRAIFLDDEPALRIERAPRGVLRLARALDALSDAPARYFDDPIVFMGLRTALHEVRRARGAEGLTHLDEDLWQIALRAELGTLADARQALDAAQQALNDAMARGADATEMSALFDAYERAMQNYMAALAREAMENGEMAGGQGGAGMDTLNADMLQELLDALREATELGDTEGARRALAQLQELLRNLQMNLAGGGEGQGDSPLAQALREALGELGDALGEQRELMDETFEESREGSGAPEPGEDESRSTGEGDDLSQRQRALAERLGELGAMTPGEDGDEALARAGEAMEEAGQALEEGDAEAALEAQNEAVEALREAAGDLAETLLAEEGGQQQNDPLGRQSGGQGAGDADVPSESERQRARQILEELRRRAAEQGRSREELDYIERLLERF